MEFSKRVKILRKSKGITQEALSVLVNVDRSSVAKWETGKALPAHDVMLKLSNIFEISINELLGEANTEKRIGVKVPVYGRVAAGIPIEAIEDIIDYEEISEDMARNGEYIALQIKGDSMEPKISDGDIVIVRLQSDFNNGDTVIVLVNGDEATCKKIKKTPEGVMLISTNSAFEPMFYSAKQVEDLPVRVLGKVVELRAKF